MNSTKLRTGPELVAGRYEIERKLGEGGMASVFRVRDLETGRNLALKRLEKAGNAKVLALFEREYHTLASLRHPAIVRAFDYASDHVSPYYTMELLLGSDISSLAPMPWQRVCKIVRDAASGIALLHTRRLVHRDLSARNVWLTAEGDVKLIDFGTLADFGKATDVVGTAPFIPPEALHGAELDQRSDLYSLGALAYFLLTGRHAFPAHTLAALDAMWSELPRFPSKRVAELGREDLPSVPAALDELVMSLLSRDKLARPSSAAELIEQLSVIASLTRERPLRVLESYLSAPRLVGCQAEREKLRVAIAAAMKSEGQNVFVQSQAGLGRSRFLAEVGLEARLGGAVVLSAESHAALGTHEVALSLSLALLTALPAARELAKPFAPTLGHLSPLLRERLGLRSEELAAIPQTHGEARMRIQSALRDWFLAVASEHALVLLADDVDSFDDASAAWLATLAREVRNHKILIVCSAQLEGRALSLAVESLRQHAQGLRLKPFTRDETHELFRSVFGDVPYLARLSDRIHQRTEGNPGHAIELAEHLSREGIVTYADGTWHLPQSIDEVALPESREDAELARLAQLTPEAKTLGQLLSIREGNLPLAMCAAMSSRASAELIAPLEELVASGVLVRSSDGYRFTRDSLRLALNAQLSREDEQRAQRNLGHFLLASEGLSQSDRLKAGLHLLRGGDESEGSRVVALSGQHYGLVDLADIGPVAPTLELALEHFKQLDKTPYEQISLLAPLALGGYYADKRLATRYGQETVALLARLVGLSVARRLQPWLGKKLGLVLGLAWGALNFAVRAKNPRVPKFKQAMMMLFNCVSALTGASTLALDIDAARRYGEVLRPMLALGKDHVAGFMFDFCTNLIGTLRDQPAAGRSRWMAMIERLDRPKTKQDLGDVHALYLAGGLYAWGVGECRRDESAALACADRLESFKLKLYDMSADQIRMFYYANRGDIEAFERYRNKVEVHAIQRGTAWQLETWMAGSLASVHARTGDMTDLKVCVEQTKRLGVDLPSLLREHYRTSAAYLVLRGTPREALRVLEEHPEEPGLVVGWLRTEGMRARAYNDLGEHQRAKETCDNALTYATDEDLRFPGQNLGVLIEQARAKAGLGDAQGAEAQLRELVEDYAEGANPLTLGALHEALCELALQRGDELGCRRELAEVERWFAPTRHPALVARYGRLLKRATPARERAAENELGTGVRWVTVLHNLRHGGDSSVRGSAAWTLKQLAEMTDVREAYLFVQDAQGATVCVASIPDNSQAAALTPWVDQELSAEVGEPATCTVGLDSETPTDVGFLALGALSYRMVLLRAGQQEERVIGALVLPRAAEVPSHVIREIAARMHTSVSLHSAVQS